MPSSAERTFKLWNRKLHYYLGLYFLFFTWLFAFTGLLLNHSWKFAEFWPNRRVASFERQIARPAPASDPEQAKDVMRQLGIAAEIEWTARRTDPARLDFRATRPGLSFEIKTDLNQGLAKVERTDLNAWGAMRILHTFTGNRINDSRNRRDWILTSVWAFSMDAVAAGLVLIVLTSLYMWYGLPAKRRLGAAALGLGLLSCGWFVWGLR